MIRRLLEFCRLSKVKLVLRVVRHVLRDELQLNEKMVFVKV